MAEEDIYKNLVKAIVKKQTDILGKEVAYKRANNVQGLRIEEGEVLTFFGKPQQIVVDLVNQYKDLSGDYGVKLCRDAAKPILETHPEIDLFTKYFPTGTDRIILPKSDIEHWIKAF